MTEEKGIRVFCEAVTKAKVKAIVVGSGILLGELQKQYPDIEFVGWKYKQEMTTYIQKARCLIFPSIWYETFGLTPMEVMAYGIPIICSDCCAAQDYITDKTGTIYNSCDSGDLTEKIRNMQDDKLVKTLSENTFNSISDYLVTTNLYTDKLIKIYNGEI